MVLSLGFTACTSQAPTRVMTPLSPLPTLNQNVIQKGREVYLANCASCHGAEAEGAPNWPTPCPDGLTQAPPHDDSGHTWHHTDRVLYETIYSGMGDPLKPGSPLRMPAFGNKLSDQEIRTAIEYFKSLWSDEHRRWQVEEMQKN